MDVMTSVVTLVITLNTIAAIVTVFRETREIAATWAWMILLVFVPVGGFVIYFFFGRKISKERIFDLRSQEALGLSEIAEGQIERLEDNPESFLDNPFVRDLAVLFLESDESIVTIANDVEVLFDGKDKFDQLKEDLRQAQHHIHLLYYIFRDDELGRELMDILIERAQAGVEVLLVYDAMGSRGTKVKFWKELMAAGGKAVPFFGYAFGFINLRINYRNHRKIVVIDGKVGYVGGFNVGDEYLGKGELGYWRDTHLRIQGNAVLTLQSRFFIDWNAAVSPQDKKEYLEEYFPISDPVGKTAMQIVSTGPDNDFQKIKMGFIKMILMARKTIDIQSPYFIPDESVLEALQIAAMSGVTVRIMIPSKPDHPFVYRATEFYSKLMASTGVHIYVYEPGFLHAKTMVVDGKVATVGTSNFDVRSFRLNFEVNAFIYDESVAKTLQEQFNKDLADCKPATKRYFEKQSVWKKLKQSFSRLLAPIL